jgi:hypothetical protein
MGQWKGVHKTGSGKYMIKIKHKQQQLTGLGCNYTCAKEAALVYNYKAKELFGEYANYNQVFS